MDTGELRRSIRVGVTGESVTFWSDLPYAAIHNDGGTEIPQEKQQDGGGQQRAEQEVLQKRLL